MSSLPQPDTPGDFGHRRRPPQLRALEPAPTIRRRRTRRLDGYRGAILVCAVAAALVAALWLAPLETLDASSEVIGWIEARLTPAGQALATTGLAAIALLSLALAWGRATALRRPVSLPAGGRIAVDEIAGRLQQMVEARDDITRAEIRVDNLHRRGVRVSSRIHVASHANLSGAIHAVSEATELLLHGHLLVRLSSPPSIEVHFDELDLRSGRVHDQRTSAAHR